MKGEGLRDLEQSEPYVCRTLTSDRIRGKPAEQEASKARVLLDGFDKGYKGADLSRPSSFPCHLLDFAAR